MDAKGDGKIVTVATFATAYLLDIFTDAWDECDVEVWINGKYSKTIKNSEEAHELRENRIAELKHKMEACKRVCKKEIRKVKRSRIQE